MGGAWKDTFAMNGTSETTSLGAETQGLNQPVALIEPGTALDGVEFVTDVDFPTRLGHFRLYGFYDHQTDEEHTALVLGDVRGAQNLPVRVHSECHTGDVWGSLRCDCREQLELAVSYVAERKAGVVVYMRQEGRGIGLMNKLRAYKLQELGFDTVEANEQLGFPAEARDYRVTACILRLLGVKSLELMSNNPDKIEKLKAYGVEISGRIPIVAEPNPHNQAYMDTKRLRMRHTYGVEGTTP
ncbi:MAG: GTP cyclohydrolase II [Spirochaetaceae bacterium]|nr:MAG: GTP cyclohydrolase II [Spirochaetaceae bacterium]